MQKWQAQQVKLQKVLGRSGRFKSLSATMNDALVDGVTSDVKTVGTMIADLNTRFGATGETLKNLTKQFDDFSNVTGTGQRSNQWCC